MPAQRDVSMRTIATSIAASPRRGQYARDRAAAGAWRARQSRTYLKRAAAAGLAWPLPQDFTDEVLELRLFGRAGVANWANGGTLSRTGRPWRAS